MPRTRIKICGITRPEDGLAAAAAGADAIGLVFYEPSPRAVTLPQASLISRALPPFVTRVGLFVDPTADWVEQACAEVDLDVLQFHGKESAAFCEQFSRPYIKALAVKPDDDLATLTGQYSKAQGLLLDAWHPQLPGGTGQTFDWTLIPQTLRSSVILAGGLTPDNVSEAVRQIKPYAVDVSGGVEMEKGIKCSDRIQAFVNAVKQADQ